MSKAIQDERDLDPVGIGYTGNDVTDAALMNSLSTGRTAQASGLTSGELYEALDKTEYAALGAADQKIIDILLGIGDMNIDPTSKTRADLLAIFGAGTATRTDLIEAVTSTISRATELGFGTVHSRNFK